MAAYDTLKATVDQHTAAVTRAVTELQRLASIAQSGTPATEDQLNTLAVQLAGAASALTSAVDTTTANVPPAI